MTVPVDNAGGSRVGITLFNYGPSDATLTLCLLNTAGGLVDTRAHSLSARSRESKFVDELFPGMPAEFEGAVAVSSTAPVAGVALRLTHALVATIPVLAPSLSVSSYLLPQVANGSADTWSIKTTFVLTNPSNRPAGVTLTLTQDDGTPFVVPLAGEGTASAFRIDLAPGHTRLLRTTGTGPLATGAAVITSNAPIGVSALFSIFSDGQLVSEAGVLDASALNTLTVPVDTAGGTRIGIMLFNSSPVRAQLTLRLLDAEGRFVASHAQPLNAKFHEARFVDELFSEMPADFKGAVSITSTAPIAAVAIRVTNSLMSTIPAIKGTFR
jgi:hypothetical protein